MDSLQCPSVRVEIKRSLISSFYQITGQGVYLSGDHNQF